MKNQNALLREKYKEILFDQFEEKRIRLDISIDELIQKTLDRIIDVSCKNKIYTNSIRYIFLYINNDDELFTNKYIACNSANNFRHVFEENFQSINLKTTTNQRPFLDFLKEFKKPLFITEDGKAAFNYFAIENEKVISIDAPIPGDFFLKSYKCFKDYIDKEKLPKIAQSLAVIPITNLIIDDAENKIGGLCFLFFDKIKFQNAKEIKNNLNTFEFELIYTTMLSFSEIAYEYTKEKAIELSKIYLGLYEVNKLFVHSFGGLEKRIEESLEWSNGSPDITKMTNNNLKELLLVSRDLRLIKDIVVTQMTDIKFNSYININKVLNLYITNPKQDEEKLSCGYINREIVLIDDSTYSNKERCQIDENVFIIICDTILNNAIKAIDGKKEKKILIKIKYENLRSITAILFYDNGIGIKKSFISEVFKTKSTSFWKNKDKKGSGVGLYLCKALLDLFNGKIAIFESDIPNYSTCVKIELPNHNKINWQK
jgi:hypothetical protein